MDPIKLINTEFDVEFANKTYKVRKASVEKVILFQTRMVELTKAEDSSFDVKAAAYCIYLALKDADPAITEQWVLENAPGDLDPYQIFEQLGFLNRQKVEQMKSIVQRNAPVPKTEPAPTGESSST